MTEDITELKPTLRKAPVAIERLERTCFRHPLVIDDLAGIAAIDADLNTTPKPC